MNGTFVSSNYEPQSVGDSPRHVDASFDATTSSSWNGMSGAQRAAQSAAATILGDKDGLIRARLGVGSGLFTALQAKHAPTASHCLRVALGTVSFARLLHLPANQIDEIEVAALLHDVGKISVPDGVLTKPGPLTSEEAALMSQHWSAGQQILASCLQHSSIMDIVKYASVRFDGNGGSHEMSGKQIPLGARMLAVADAFDAMTTHQVYRPAMTHEVALSELLRFAGTQFDPELVQEFAEISKQILTDAQVDPSAPVDPGLNPWAITQPLSGFHTHVLATIFPVKLIESMRDGVIFTDVSGRIVAWNQAAERLTGIPAVNVLNRMWDCAELDLRDLSGNVIRDARCPVDQVVRQNRQNCLLGSIRRPNDKRLSIEINAHVVTDEYQTEVCCGAIILLRDISSETHLRDQVQVLHKQATTDGLTGLNNRNLFDRKFAEMIAACRRNGTTCSVIIADIDFFKRVNDHYGHQAGDDVLVTFATLLQRLSRKDDWVMRYGGEEFVVLCPDCDGTMAIQRAESMRCELAKMEHEALLNQNVTASFGVTELQYGDDPEAMLDRADQALYQAKKLGRNRVSSFLLAEPVDGLHDPRIRHGWSQQPPLESSVEHVLKVRDSRARVLERIQGFAVENALEIVHCDSTNVLLSVDTQAFLTHRRLSDRPTAFAIECSLSAKAADGTHQPDAWNTMVYLKIRPLRNRDRRVSTDQQATLIVDMLRAKLTAKHA